MERNRLIFFGATALIVSGVVIYLIFNNASENSLKVDWQNDKPSVEGQLQTSPTPTNDFYNTADFIVREYIDFMRDKKFEKLLNKYSTHVVGEVNPQSELYQITPEKIIEKGFKGNELHLAVLEDEYEFIKSGFGEDAWNHVTFELIESRSPESKSQFIEKSTGEVITEKEYLALSKKYWENIAEQEGMSVHDIFPEDDSNEKALITGHLIQEKYRSGLPVEWTSEDMYKAYQVKFYFNGKDTASTGQSQFQITITNKDDQWSIFSGLYWEPPIDNEPKGDI